MKPSFLKKDTQLWCDLCDANKVHSEKPETGDFLTQEGHICNLETGELSEKYTMVIYAICSDCRKPNGGNPASSFELSA